MYLSDDEQSRIDAYLASQNYFAGVAQSIVERMILSWLERNLPRLLYRLRQAAVSAWDAIRDFLGI
jgi:hypothetical protein